jgi:CxxC motif-containing protein (DUF1111 family)
MKRLRVGDGMAFGMGKAWFRRAILGALLFASASGAATLQPPGELSGGATSVRIANASAFSLPAANMPLSRRLDFSVGNSFFRNPWVIAPSSTAARDGLGPLFNTNACQNCHIKDGRGHPPEPGHVNQVSMLVRLSIAPRADGSDAEALRVHGNVPEPTYGLQLQDFAVANLAAEGRVNVAYWEFPVTLADGTIVMLRRPMVSISDLGYGPLHPDTELSARVAPPMIGLGLLAALTAEDILSREDPEDSDGDGISGRANRVWDASGSITVLGRFGWKAGQPNLSQQNAAAFNNDMGITSLLLSREECPFSKDVCRSLSGGAPELEPHIHEQVDFYTANLAVPVRRNLDDPAVHAGWQVFLDAGCAACHTPTWTTGASPHEWLSNQTIHPFTDLLLHDMGPGLADGRSEFLASGSEWRTPPLWGIGLTETVGGHFSLLHDGRARNLLEAILWHGGEAAASQQAVRQLPTRQRNDLLAFLNSL